MASQTSFPIGEKIGPYTLLGKLAKGGMGEVYRAQDGRLGREVAIKFLLSGLGEQEEQRFEQEARIAGSLAHPHVVTVFDVGRHQGRPYLVTELLQGQTLRELLFRGPLPRGRAVALVLQLLEGLDAAHGKGVVHRDLKPENLFVTESGPLKILDFGIAKVHASADAGGPQVRTRSGVVMGTIGYAAPEQLEAKLADARTDLYSVGLLLHEMLLGHHPLSGKSQVEMAEIMLHAGLPPLPDEVPAPLRAVVLRCEERAREKRFASARELIAALRATGTDDDGPPSTPAGAPSSPAVTTPDRQAALTTSFEGRNLSSFGWGSVAVLAAVLLVPLGAAWLLLRREGGGAAAKESGRASTPAAADPRAGLEASAARGALLLMAGDIPAEVVRTAECAALAEQAGAAQVKARCLRDEVRALVLSCEPQKALAADARFRQAATASGLDATEVVEQPGVAARFAAGRVAEAAALLEAAARRAPPVADVADKEGQVRLLLGPQDAFSAEPSAAAAEARVAQALALAASLQQPGLLARAQLATARVALTLGKPGAREQAAAAAAAFEKLGAPAFEAHARATLSLALLAEKLADGAAAEAAKAAGLSDRTRWRGAQLAAAEALVAVHAAAGKKFALQEDAGKLERLRDSAERAGCVPERLRAQAAIARAERAANPGKATTASPAAEGRALGYLDLAE